jgi:Flp pilus assembly protein TadD
VTPPTGADPAVAAADVSDVRVLARRAEALLTAGQRDRAIAVLTQITRLHAHEPAARAALLDLAPLLKAAGRVDEARCAYRLYLERYPGKAQLGDDVRKALDRLGDGPACNGLSPR